MNWLKENWFKAIFAVGKFILIFYVMLFSIFIIEEVGADNAWQALIWFSPVVGAYLLGLISFRK